MSRDTKSKMSKSETIKNKKRCFSLNLTLQLFYERFL